MVNAKLTGKLYWVQTEKQINWNFLDPLLFNILLSIQYAYSIFYMQFQYFFI